MNDARELPGHRINPCEIDPALGEGQGQKQPISLAETVDALCSEGCSRTSAYSGGIRRALPSRDVISKMVESLRSVLFPGYFGESDVTAQSMRFYVGATLDKVQKTLKEQIRRGLCFTCKEMRPERCGRCDEKALRLANSLLGELPVLQRILEKDVIAAYEGDPAAGNPDEAIFCYPGIIAITNHRLANVLHGLEVPLIPRIIAEQAHGVTGIDIHPGASIGESFFIDHGTGVVIGETAIIGDRVRIYQGVTLGAKSLPSDEAGKPIKGILRHPVVEDDVVIYSGATILGRIIIGRGSVIGGNVWLTCDVPPHSKITQVRAREDRFEQGGGI